MEKIKLFAFDLDGTLTQHKTPLEDRVRGVLARLSENARLCMVGAGMCERVFKQMKEFPIDIIGNYGMQVAYYRNGKLETVLNSVLPADRDSVEERVTAFRQKHGFTEFAGDNVEYHSSGCITLPILGTKAEQKDKLAFDPDRKNAVRYTKKLRRFFPNIQFLWAVLRHLIWHRNLIISIMPLTGTVRNLT